jgi:hypothetical protein
MFWLLIPKALRPLKVKIHRGAVVILEGTVKNPPHRLIYLAREAAPAAIPVLRVPCPLLSPAFQPAVAA